MKPLLLGIICFLLQLTSHAHAQDVTPEMEATFLNKLKTSVAQKDFDAFSALLCKDGSLDAEMKGVVEKMTHETFDTIVSEPAPAYQFSPVPSNQLTSFTHNGKNYEMNLKPIKLIKISFPNAAVNTSAGGTWSFPLGVKEGALLIVQTVEKSS